MKPPSPAAETLPRLITGDCLVQSPANEGRVIQESGRFSEEKLRKRLLLPLHGVFKRPLAENSEKFFASFSLAHR